MNIKDFRELTSFIDEELEKMTESTGIKSPSTKFIEYRETTILKYVGLYDKFLFEKEKRNVRIQKAIDTMPHGWLWKFFHKSLWAIIKDCDNKATKDSTSIEKDETKEQILYPEVIKSQSPPQIDNDSF